jgi:hypothetical protein
MQQGKAVIFSEQYNDNIKKEFLLLLLLLKKLKLPSK